MKTNSRDGLSVLQARLRFSLVVNAILVAVVVFLSIVVYAQNNDSQTVTVQSADSSNDNSTPSSNYSHLRNDPDDPMAIGDINAPVVLSEWTDYRCPFCAVFANDTLRELLEEYVESGKLRIEFNDVYFFGDDSRSAAIAARAAAEQGYYLEYIEALYSAAPDSGHPDLPRETLIVFARTAGIPDIAKFESDLDSEVLAASVDESNSNAQNLGITSVPFFVVDDQAVAGAQPLETFRNLIDSNLSE